jgi:hypothetical protein
MRTQLLVIDGPQPLSQSNLIRTMAERLGCVVYSNSGTIAMLGSKYQLRELIDYCVENSLSFERLFTAKTS